MYINKSTINNYTLVNLGLVFFLMLIFSSPDRDYVIGQDLGWFPLKLSLIKLLGETIFNYYCYVENLLTLTLDNYFIGDLNDLIAMFNNKNDSSDTLDNVEQVKVNKNRSYWYYLLLILLFPFLIYLSWFIFTAEDNLPSSEGIESPPAHAGEVSGKTPLDTADSEAQFEQRWTVGMKIRFIITFVKKFLFG